MRVPVETASTDAYPRYASNCACFSLALRMFLITNVKDYER